MKLQLKRSNVLVSGAAKEPTAAQLDYGELAINYSATDAAIFLKDSSNNVIRIAGVHNIADDGLTNVPTTTSPPTTPTPEAGNLWYNSEDGRLYIYYVDDNSSQWVDASPDTWQTTVIPDITNPAHQAGTLDDRYVNINGDTLTGALLLENAATAATPDLAFNGDPNTGIYSPGANELAITTGGAQRVTVDSSGDVGIGTTSASAKLHIETNAVDAAKLRLGFDSTRYYDIFRGSATNSGLLNFYGSQSGFTGYVFDGVDGERMRITSSGNVGIGTTSPGKLLHLKSTTAGTVMSLEGAGTTYLNFISSTDTTGYISYGGTNLGFWTNNSEKMRIDGSGNVGIGTLSPSDTLHLNGSTGYGLKITDGSSHIGVYRTHSDGVILKTASSHALLFGTSDTEAMRITSSGRLLVGTTDIQAHPNMDDLQLGDGTGNRGLTISSGTSGFGSVAFGDSADGSGTDRYQGLIEYYHNDDSMSFYTNAIMRMKIDSSGKVGIGESSPDQLLHLKSTGFPTLRVEDADNSTYFDIANSDGDIILKADEGNTFANSAIRFMVDSSEHMRIDSSGNVLIGKTSVSTAAGTGVQLITGSAASVDVVTNAASNIGVCHLHNLNATRNGYRFYLHVDGGIRNFSSSNVNLSDEREKKNIVDMDSTWSELKQWTLRQFHFNDQDDSEDKCYGVVAQQIETVSPQVLSTFETNPTTIRKGVKEQKMMWMAIKALQEAQARIETLEQRLSDADIA